MTKTERFQNGAQKITYLDVMRSFNNLNKILGGEYYASSADLITPEGKRAPGFIYTGYAAGVGIRRILDTLNIKYTTHMQGGSGVYEESEIHITDAKSQKRFLDILKKCGRFQSNEIIESDMMNENKNNSLSQHIR